MRRLPGSAPGPPSAWSVQMASMIMVMVLVTVMGYKRTSLSMVGDDINMIQ